MSLLRADKLIQKEVQTVWRESHFSVLLEYIYWTYFSMCFEATLLNVQRFFIIIIIIIQGWNQSSRGKSKFFSTPLLSSLIIPLEFFFRLFSLSVMSVLGHFPSNPWRFCQSSILSLARILGTSAELQSVSNPYSSRVSHPSSLIFVHFFAFSHWPEPTETHVNVWNWAWLGLEHPWQPWRPLPQV